MQGARTGSHSYSILREKVNAAILQTQKPDRWSGTIFISAQGCGRYQISMVLGVAQPEWHRGTSGVHGRDGHKIDLRLETGLPEKI